MVSFKNIKISSTRHSVIETNVMEGMLEVKPITGEKVYDTLKESSEILSIINAFNTGLWSDGFDIVKTGNGEISDEAVNHLDSIGFFKKAKEWSFDGLLNGDSYLELTKADVKTIKSAINKSFKSKYLLKSRASKKILKQITSAIDTRFDSFQPFNLFNIKGGSVEIQVDKSGESMTYQQLITSNPSVNDSTITGGFTATPVKGNNIYRVFDPDQIIRYTPFGIGEVYGLSPLRTLSVDLSLLINAKKYANAFFENGGSINELFILRNGSGLNDKNYELLTQALRKFKNVRNKQASLALTGDIDYQKLNEFNKDMEFLGMTEMVTQRVAMAYSVPPSKVPYVLNSKTGDLKELTEAFWDTISVHQKMIESIFNNNIFASMGLRFVFKKNYRIDELREAQIITMLLDRRIITVKEARDRINYIGPVPEELLAFQEMEGIAPRPAAENPHRDMGDKQEGGRGTGEDGGAKLAKDSDNINNILKSTSNAVTVSFQDFVKIVEAFETFEKAKVLVKDLPEHIEIYFSDIHTTYKSVISKSVPNFADVLFILRNAIKIS